MQDGWIETLSDLLVSETVCAQLLMSALQVARCEDGRPFRGQQSQIVGQITKVDTVARGSAEYLAHRVTERPVGFSHQAGVRFELLAHLVQLGQLRLQLPGRLVVPALLEPPIEIIQQSTLLGAMAVQLEAEIPEACPF